MSDEETQTSTSKTSRRSMLRLAVPAAAGVAALAAAGAVELGHAPAARADVGDSLILGSTANSAAGNATGMSGLSGNTGSAYAFLVNDESNSGHNTSAVFGASANNGILGVSGGILSDSFPLDKTNTGVYGLVVHGSQGNGYGVKAHADRAQAPLLLISTTGTSANGVPTTSAANGAVNVDNNGTLYSRRFGGWYNLSSFNFLSAPVRIIGATAPGAHLSAGSKTTYNVAGHNTIPTNAVAIFGNVNIAAGVSGPGFVTVTAKGGAATTNTINFTSSDVRLSNFCMVRLSGGAIDVHVSNNVPVDFSFDCVGYII